MPCLMPLIRLPALSPHWMAIGRGEGTSGGASCPLRPACGEKVAGRPDEGQVTRHRSNEFAPLLGST
ncbi:hypothetical protein FB001_104201 [Ensifer sp. SEMIA 135]|nr:hypothetical protein FB000_107101 [Ensifer sp. SEMIA 134]TWB38417.1 hypothetical protein FB001_104201 [Ensifer sp. SEMIA 135]